MSDFSLTLQLWEDKGHVFRLPVSPQGTVQSFHRRGRRMGVRMSDGWVDGEDEWVEGGQIGG